MESMEEERTIGFVTGELRVRVVREYDDEFDYHLLFSRVFNLQ